LACIPFGLLGTLFTGGERSVKDIAKLKTNLKLIKLIKLLRILKIVKEQKKFFKYMDDYLGIGLGFQRLLFFGMIFILASHIVSCFWLILAELVSNDPVYFAGTWLNEFAIDKAYKNSDISLYYISFYWTITTITTVGYGDISGTNNYERMFASFVMVVGVILFSIANGALASIISSLDG